MYLDVFGIHFLSETMRMVGILLGLISLSGAIYVFYQTRGKLDSDAIANLILAVVGIGVGIALATLQPPVYLRYYGILIVTGAVVGAYVSTLEARRIGLNPDYVWDGLIWCLIAGVIGARLYHVLTPPPSMIANNITTEYYFQNPIEIIRIDRGGLGIPGGVIGGVLGLWLYTYRQKLNFGTWLDLGAPALLLAQAIGRWGNYVNQEVYGLPTNLPWAIYIEQEYRLAEYVNTATYHPLFLYESILNLLGMGGLLWLGRRYAKQLKAGDLFLIYLIIYPVIRFFLEFLRLDSVESGNLNINQTLMGIVAVVAAVMLVIRHRRQRRIGSAVSVEPEEILQSTEND